MLFAGVWEEPQGGGHGGRLCPAEPGAAGLLLSLDGKVTDQNNPKKPTTAVSGCWPTPDGCPPRPRAAPPSSSSPTPGGPWWPSCGCCCRRGRCPSGPGPGSWRSWRSCSASSGFCSCSGKNVKSPDVWISLCCAGVPQAEECPGGAAHHQQQLGEGDWGGIVVVQFPYYCMCGW